MTRHIVIRPVVRKEGRDKVTGRAIYVDDYALPGMLHGVTIRTPSARGRIRGISFAPHIPWDEFVVVTAKDEGDVRFRFEITAKELTAGPLVQETSTTISK